MRYIDGWLTGLGLEYIIPKLKDNGINTPKKLAQLTLRDMYEVVGVEVAEDRKKLYFLIQRLQVILNNKPGKDVADGSSSPVKTSPSKSSPKSLEQNVKVLSPKSSPDGKIWYRMAGDEGEPSEQTRTSEEDLRKIRQNRRSSSQTTNPNPQYEIDHRDVSESNGIDKDHSQPPPPPPMTKAPQPKARSSQIKSRSASAGVHPQSVLSQKSVPTARDNIRAQAGDGAVDNRWSRDSSVSASSVSKLISPRSMKLNLSEPKQALQASPEHYEQRRLSNNSTGSNATSPLATRSIRRTHSNESSENQEPQYSSQHPVASTGQDDFEVVDMAIRVVVRKRPISKRELNQGDRDVMDVDRGGVVRVHEPKVKVDLTKVVETQTFTFDDAFEAVETNEQIYSRTISHLVRFIFESGKASCFAYGQTGSGKTFSMMGCRPDAPETVTVNAGLYVLAARDIFNIVRTPKFKDIKVYVSCFEIYGGKLFDLLNDRGVVKCLEDAKQQVQLPGLTEHMCKDSASLLKLMAVAHTNRSTGSTGANAESSRSHQVMQIVIKDPAFNPKKAKGGNPNMFQGGKLSFIDLAGSERGADTNSNSKQTRMEGAEINTSLLALKEVIRSLEKKHGHTPFRGSKLTQVLKDSFVGDRTRTCMVACVSPSHSNCEHTLNTLRYADRVKEHNHSNMEDKGHTPGVPVQQGAAYNSSDVSFDSAYDRQQQRSGSPARLAQHRSGSALPVSNRPLTAGSPVRERGGSKSSGRGVAGQDKSGGFNKTPSRPSTAGTAYTCSPGGGQRKPPASTNVRVPVKSGVASGRSASVSRISLKCRDEVKKPASSRLGSSQSPVPLSSRSINSADRNHGHGHGHGYGQPVGSSSSSGAGTGAGKSAVPFRAKSTPSSSLQDSPMSVGQESPPSSSKGSRSSRSSISSPLHSDKPTKYDLARRVSGQMRRVDEDEDDMLDINDSVEDLLDVDDADAGFDAEVDAFSNTELIERTVGLLSAHKAAIADMVEVMKDEMELVQDMENVDDRNSELYIDKLERILDVKSEAIYLLRTELNSFQQYRSIV